MRLGIVVTNEAAAAALIGLAMAATARGWECRCFFTDLGVRLATLAPLLVLVRESNLRLDVCELSWEKYGMGTSPDGVVMGSQYQNAELAHLCDRVLVL